MAVMRIQELRTKIGMTQAKLGAHMGVAQCVVSEWEKEVYLPKARDLPALAKALGVEISDLFVNDFAKDEEVS